jgi:hypothetical protein
MSSHSCTRSKCFFPLIFPNKVTRRSLNIPASNCAILQRGDDLELLPAGQHYITNPNVTLRGLYTLGENQLEMPTKDM